MNVVDIILILGVVLSALRGWRIGLLMSLASLLSVLVGYAAALTYGKRVAAELAGGNTDPGAMFTMAGFVLVFILAALICYVLGRVLHTLVRATPFGLFDGAAGALVGAAGGVLVLGLVVILLRAHPPHESIPDRIDESALGGRAQRTALLLVDAITTVVPGAERLQHALGLDADPANRPELVDRLSRNAGDAKARLDSLLRESKKRLDER